MKEKEPVYFYSLYLVRTAGIKSIIYRIIHNSYWDSVAFISEHGSVIGVNYKGIYLTSLPEFRKDYDVVSIKKTKSFYIEENTAFDRFMKLLKKRRSLFYDYRNIIQKIFKKMTNIELKDERKICSVEFIINMFDVSKEISYNDKSIDWFSNHDIYDFLNLPKNDEV